MTEQLATMQRPQRWDVPFGNAMTARDVNALLRRPPFCNMDSSRFPRSTPLEGILQNDTRIVEYDPGDLIIREGEYGNSAFLVLRGNVRVCLESLPRQFLGQSTARRRGWFQAFAQLWTNSHVPEVRLTARGTGQAAISNRASENGTRVFLQDVSGVLDEFNTLQLGVGEMFGELAVMSRCPRTATVFAAERCQLLEIRWQGLRLLRRDPGLQKHLDQLYRENSLRVHLRETPLLRTLPEHDLEAVAAATMFDSFGSFEWFGEYKQLAGQDPNARVSAEPLIAEEGHYINDLLMIRSGFARVSQRHGNGHQTLAYLGKGRVFGMTEIAHHWLHGGEPLPFQKSLRAIGYVDVLRVPTRIVQQHILPHVNKEELPSLAAQATTAKSRPEIRDGNVVLPSPVTGPPTALIEFFVDNRLNNGKMTMVIDLDRCVRCDDCVRACAAAHDNNPRFVREGLRYGKYQFAHACMHCADPTCMIGCPTGAIARDEESGNVRINDTTCIGCSTCANNCPYHNIQMVEIRQPNGTPLFDAASHQPIMKATKCDLCSEQLTGPACQSACGHDALIRIDLTDAGSFAQWSQR